MNQNILPVLYIDPQNVIPRNRCCDCEEICFGKRCLRCERKNV